MQNNTRRHTVFEPQVEAQELYNNLYQRYLKFYSSSTSLERVLRFGDVLPRLMQIARSQATEPSRFSDKPNR